MMLQRAAMPFPRFLASVVVLGVLSIPAFPQHYTQTNLVSNNGVPGTKSDPKLVNAWGISRFFRQSVVGFQQWNCDQYSLYRRRYCIALGSNSPRSYESRGSDGHDFQRHPGFQNQRRTG
jgi:hypothetical protein